VTEPQEPPYGHEPPAIAERRVIRVGVILALLLVSAALAIHVALRRVAPQHAQVVARPATVPPAPRLDVHPSADLAVLEARKNALLSTWNWADPGHNFARIPIERAIAIYAQQQADAAKTAPTPQGAAP
jgi:hypothetical protein